MRPGRFVAAAVAAVALAAGSPAYGQSTPAPDLQIEQDKSSVSVVIGDHFGFTSTVKAPQGASGLVAHLNILSLDPETYVDPEDWSGERTQYLADIPAGGEAKLPWEVQAVNDGKFVVYVAISTADPGRLVVAGPGLRADVASQQVINAGGIVPLAAGIPAALLVLLVATRLRRRHHS